jgi:NAD-dependent SIR2 family protein deacetylase
MDSTSAEGADGDALRSLARAIREADSTVVMTGAGVSTASGIPDFRSSGGVWERHDPREFRIDRFEHDPAGFWVDRLSLHETTQATKSRRSSPRIPTDSTTTPAPRR